MADRFGFNVKDGLDVEIGTLYKKQGVQYLGGGELFAARVTREL